MKAIGRNLIIEKLEEKTTKTEGGLFLGEKHREDIDTHKLVYFQ